MYVNHNEALADLAERGFSGVEVTVNVDGTNTVTLHRTLENVDDAGRVEVINGDVVATATGADLLEALNAVLDQLEG